MLKIKKLEKNSEVYDITVDKVHNFYANNALVHNCQEITLPTTPIKDINDEDGEIALCMLGGLNLGKVSGPDTFHKLETPCRYLVRALDKIMDIQDYPVKASEKQKGRRSIGIGVTNFAYFLAKNGLSYEDEKVLPLVDELFEHIQFYLIKASMELAQENGPCELFSETKYAKGILPIDRYNKNVDKLVNREYTLDWEWLREMVLKHGMANSVLTAIMPSESCVTKDTKITLADGTTKSYKDIFKEQSIDIEALENDGTPKWVNFNKPFDVKTMEGSETCDKFYYNGKKEIFEIELEDGNVYKMTENHKLLVNREGVKVWVRADELVEGDDVINIKE